MSPCYANVPPSAHPSHHQSPVVGANQYPRPAPHTLALPHNNSSPDFDRMIHRKYADSNRRLHATISHASFPNPETRRQCSELVEYLRIHKNLFVHTYVHVVSCESRQLRQLVCSVNAWKEWRSVGQLIYHSTIKDELLKFWANPCRQHVPPLAQRAVTSDDDSDLLCHLLYCGRKSELYTRGSKESKFVVELLWQFLMQEQESGVARRLRAQIYRMTRKSAFLPDALRFGCSSISNRRNLGAGAKARVTKATMNIRGAVRDVVIKEIVCSNHDTQRKCLEMFASEAILWSTLQHKNIVPFLGVVTEATLNMGLVSPFFKKGNIRNYIRNCDPRHWRTLAHEWGRELAEALDYIHGHEPPIVHGDLKGDNVLVDDAGHALLGDFGQSYASDSGKYLDSTRVGLATNPLYWMAPELILGGDLVTASDKSDIYSFGCVLYEMVSGRIPFEDHEPGSVLKRIKRGERPNRPESISSSDPFWGIVKSCWKDCPQDRPSAANLVFLLR